jgi:ubiquinone/menaquinone biosynthesis C-methylase UbiE
MQSARHDAEILDQFTRQAEPFAQRHGYQRDPLLELMAECAAVSPSDAVLDVACGPGIISCFFAKRARHVTGLDIVPAMLERARRFQAEQHLNNVDWQLGPSTALPFDRDKFDCVVTRFSFHHFLEPFDALQEMKRVCKPGGIVLVCDVAPSRETQTAFNHWEVLRDPSHTRALTQTELEALGEDAGLQLHRLEKYEFAKDLEDLLAGSFPNPGDTDRIRALFDADIRSGGDTLGVTARREEGAIRITYPVVILTWRKPA